MKQLALFLECSQASKRKFEKRLSEHNDTERMMSVQLVGTQVKYSSERYRLHLPFQFKRQDQIALKCFTTPANKNLVILGPFADGDELLVLFPEQPLAKRLFFS